VNTFLVFCAATLTGVVASFVTSFFTNRVAKEDRVTRVLIANEDRAFEVRREAAVNLETQRIGQLQYIKNVQLHALAFFTADTFPILPPPTDPHFSALKSIALSDEVVRLVDELNKTHEEYLEWIRKWQFGDEALKDFEVRVKATETFEKYDLQSNELWKVLRQEARIVR
jgi:hypothetical protein